MTEDKSYFLKHINQGCFFYELAILVCQIENSRPIADYTNYFWNLENVTGPFDKNFNKIEVNYELKLYGILKLGNYKFPFLTMNIQEELANGNWFDICFYTSSVEEILGLEKDYLINESFHPLILEKFFETTLNNLSLIYTFEIALAGTEMGGMYDLEIFQKEELKSPYGLFYIDTKNTTQILESNRRYLRIIDQK